MSKWRDNLGLQGIHGTETMARVNKCSCYKCKEYKRNKMALYRRNKKFSTAKGVTS